MQVAPPTPDELERLKALYDYHVLDTDAEAAFDDLTRLASYICKTPISLISLVDPDRQWFKSAYGIDAKETPRDIAFCAHAIHQREIFEIPDARKDVRFADNPLVSGDPKIRFYAGTQLLTPGGQAIGTLCVISKEPQLLDEEQRKGLEILGREVISQLELRKRNLDLEEISRRKSEFLSNISHELRTPLNAIVSFGQFLEEELKDAQVSDKAKEYSRLLNFSGNRLLGVINAVLDLTKIDEGKMELIPAAISPHGFFDSLMGMLRVRAAEKGITLDYALMGDFSERLYYDEGKLAQILTNIIGNAIKFSPENSEVKVRMQMQGDKLLFVIKDQGHGISEEDQNKLFNRFERVKEHSDVEGSGLGLVITKALVELMDGSISLTSAEGEGTVVRISLPLNIYQGNEPEGHSGTEACFDTHARIMVVEDNDINQVVARAQFQKLGLRAEIVGSGEECLELIETAPFDLVFMDLHLPGIDGFEATRALKAIRPGVPVVAMSADAFSHQYSEAKTALLDGQVTKPVDKTTLTAILNRFIPRHN